MTDQAPLGTLGTWVHAVMLGSIPCGSPPLPHPCIVSLYQNSACSHYHSLHTRELFPSDSFSVALYSTDRFATLCYTICVKETKLTRSSL
jgi:hypothetical protein